ncbi:multiple epidermal growth factor-like domains protein 8 [Haplochromis burtoni]|uniref:multiple epidermal growth factor-like domains protein 8 n=1 Tax=Haplochromis burtoni TaxID=8153 RepID=UPI001C2DC8AC|nr:multiple epidermal growth factor-like domains protein 8 [Haplochromis burtoni]
MRTKRREMAVPVMASPLPVSFILVVLLLAKSPLYQAGDCKGHRQVLRGPPGYVTDGAGNYSVNGNCEWLIKAPNNSHRIVLNFTFMNTECTYDYLFVYDGDSYQSPLLASLSGHTLPQPVEAKSGKMLLHLFSDANYNLLGFNATYTFSLCPGACGGHGRCDSSTSKCHCHQGWGGPSCTTPLCTQACSVNGQCDKKGERCLCKPGFVGQNCQLGLYNDSGAGKWWRVSEENPYTPPRTGSAGVYLSSTGAMYLFGGFDLNRALGDLIKYNFTSNQWESRSYGHSPVARHSHTAVEYMGKMVVFGGELANGSLANDVWMYRPLNDDWQQLGFSTSRGAPKLANHAAAIVDSYLYVFGGRTEEDMFSSTLYRFGLHGSGRWETVQPTGGKPPATAGHSMVFHGPSRTLLVYGGHRPTTARFSVRVNKTDVFHVDRRFWTSFRSRFAATGPRERAFHSATVIGNYMVVYGGNVHIHFHEEKCYDEEIFFYHLGCHQWVSAKEKLSGDAVRGRYSHVAAVMEGRVLLVAGGYSGIARGDLVAYKVPLFVSSDQGDRDAVCAEAVDENMCLKNPECSWCEGRCREYQPTNPCGSTGCLGLARFLSDCQSCLVFSGTPASLARAPGEFGWCVQNESCLPVSERSACRVDQISGAYGWWGERTLFLTSLHSCRTENYVPGLHLLTFQHPRNDSQPDQVTILRSATVMLGPTTEMDVALQFRGFVHPLWGGPPPAPPPTETVSMWARIQRLHFEARMATGPNSSQMEVVGHWAAQQEKELKLLTRPDGSRLFSNLTRGNHYLVQAEGYLNNSGSGQTSEMALIWNRTLPGGSEISFLFSEPYRSGSCSGYMSCLACLSDQSCGWCPSLSRCLLRDSPDLEPCPEGLNSEGKMEGQLHLLLAPQHCTMCEEYRDCSACTQDPYCEWQINSSKKGDYQCSRRGRVDGSIRDPRGCPKVCNQRKTCGECLSNSSQCAWCESAQACFYFAAYLTKYPYGECRDWYDSFPSPPGETRRILSVNPTYDWTCFSYALLNVSPMQVESSPPLPCPPPCHSLHNCSLCLSSNGSDGGWQHCVWSMALQRCMSPSFVPLRCEAGQCGRLLSRGDSCSPQCSQLTQCSQCIARPQCGWCSSRGGNGAGRCLQGGLDGVSEGVCPLTNSSWSFLHCPEEDECANGHHNCNSTQDCHDLPQGYHCTCKQGYILSSISGQCEPVCAQGCVNGTCTSPGVCQCHFGFVGDNCSSQCSCNKHSNCAGVNKPDVCLECHNNTMGKHCEKCKPLFVGSAKGGGTCHPCREFCKGNSAVCLSRDELKKAQETLQLYPLDPNSIQSWVSEGPTEENAVCVNCQNNSVGDRCESCLSGYFLLQGKCEKCQCNGHADTCNEHDGTGCPCQNNTETSSCLSSPQSDRKDCYRQQCAKCKDSFNGTPVNGRQCYRQFNVDTECCFDPTSQTNCFHDPTIRNLPKGRTVFFAAQPKFTNVDIRVTIDVTFGEVEVYVSNSHDTFIVDVDRYTGIHTIKIEEESVVPGKTAGTEKDSPPSPIKVFANTSSNFAGSVLSQSLQAKPPGAEREIREERAEGLITYITVWKPQTVLIVRGVRDRVVITFPHEVHSLKSSRFYIALRGVGTEERQGESQGLLFLRQDQAHIDLFVFFSVFFSCFFLFLSVCVLLWKVKQFLDFRREQRRHIQEMTKMASRPFAKLTIYLEPEEPQLIYLPSSGGGVGGSTVSLAHARTSKLSGVVVGQRGRAGPVSYKHDPSSGPTAHHHHHLTLGGGGNSGQHLPLHYLNTHHYASTTAGNPASHHHHPSTYSAYQHFCRPDPFLSQLMGFSYSSFKVGPITLEPTDDGMAGVATVLFQLPGGVLAPNRACLGSALVTLRQNLQEYCGHGNGGGHPGAGAGRKGLLGHQHLTTMAM